MDLRRHHHADGDDRDGAQGIGQIRPVRRGHELHGGGEGIRAHFTRSQIIRGRHERHLLEEDDRGDADGEAFDHRPGDEGHRPAEPQQSGHDDDESGDEGDGDDGLGAVAGDDRHEDDGHGTGGTGDLQVGSAEDRGEEARDDRGDRPLFGRQPGADAEAQSQRQGDDADSGAGEEVLRPGAAGLTVVGDRRQQRSGAAQRRCRAHAVSAPGIFSSERASASRCSSSSSIASSRLLATASSSAVRRSARR